MKIMNKMVLKIKSKIRGVVSPYLLVEKGMKLGKNSWSVKTTEARTVIWRRKAYTALAAHKSQYAVLHAMSIVNNDNVYWHKRTDNLLNSAILKASSGDAEKLRDFLIIDSDDILTMDARKIDYSKAMWVPEGGASWIGASWNDPVAIDCIVIHGNPNMETEQTVDILIYADGKLISSVTKIREYARGTVIKTGSIRCVELKFCVGKITDLGISEIEVFYGEQLLHKSICDSTVEFTSESNKLEEIYNVLGYKIIVLKTKIRRKIQKVLN